jgi:hypothetical protein
MDEEGSCNQATGGSNLIATRHRAKALNGEKIIVAVEFDSVCFFFFLFHLLTHTYTHKHACALLTMLIQKLD